MLARYVFTVDTSSASGGKRLFSVLKNQSASTKRHRLRLHSLSQRATKDQKEIVISDSDDNYEDEDDDEGDEDDE